jgi:hypothetical protein
MPPLPEVDAVLVANGNPLRARHAELKQVEKNYAVAIQSRGKPIHGSARTIPFTVPALPWQTAFGFCVTSANGVCR